MAGVPPMGKGQQQCTVAPPGSLSLIEEKLPLELLAAIFGMLSRSEFLAVSQVNRSWHRLTCDPVLSSKLLALHFPQARPTHSGQEGIAAYRTQCRARENLAHGIFSMSVLEGHTDSITHVSECGKWIASASKDHTLRIWDPASGKCIHTLKGHTDKVNHFAVCNKWIVSASNDRTLRFWDLASGECVHVLTGRTPITSVAAYREWIVSASGDDKLRVWDPASGTRISTLKGGSGDRYIEQVAASSNWIVATNLFDINLKVWGPAEKCTHVLKGHSRHITHFIVCDKRVVSASKDCTLRVWNPASGECIHVLEGHTNDVNHFVVCDKWIVSASDDHTLRVWDLESGKCIRILKDHNKVCNVAMLGNRVVSYSLYQPVRVWDVASGECITTLKGAEMASNRLNIFSICGDRIVLRDDDQLRVWDGAVSDEYFFKPAVQKQRDTQWKSPEPIPGMRPGLQADISRWQARFQDDLHRRCAKLLPHEPGLTVSSPEVAKQAIECYLARVNGITVFCSDVEKGEHLEIRGDCSSLKISREQGIPLTKHNVNISPEECSISFTNRDSSFKMLPNLHASHLNSFYWDFPIALDARLEPFPFRYKIVLVSGGQVIEEEGGDREFAGVDVEIEPRFDRSKKRGPLQSCVVA